MKNTADNSAYLNRVVPPNSVDAERSVIGAMLQDAKAVSEALDSLTQAAFYTPEHREIFTAIADLHERKSPVDVMTVGEELSKRGTLEGVGGAAYLLEAYRYVPTTANVRSYIAIVKEKGRLRALITQCREAEQKCYSQMDDVDAIVEALRNSIRGLDSCVDNIVRASEVATSTYDYIERKANGEDKSLMTGVYDFDQMTGGLLGGDLLVIGARPGVGKSALGMEMALNAALSGKRVLVLSREMQTIQYGLRICSRESGIHGTQLKTGSLGDNQWEMLGESLQSFSRSKIGFLFKTRTVEELTTIAQREYDENGLDLILVDYLQLMGTKQEHDKRYQEVGAVSRGLKDLAMALQIPVAALAQVGRSAAKQCPSLSDLRESGDIEQDADIVLFLHRPEDSSDMDIPTRDRLMYNAIINSGNQYLLGKFAKQRMGPIGVFGFSFDPARMRITCLDRRGA
jgi:replicative DNA helicase